MTTAHTALPELGDDRVEAIEHALFARIADERRAQWERSERERIRAVRRGRIWMGGAAAAAVVAVAAIMAPSIAGTLQGTSGASSAALPAVIAPGGSTAELGLTDGRAGDAAAGGMSGAGVAADAATGSAGREIAATASATGDVGDAAAAAEGIAAAAVAAGGYVESQSTGAGAPVDVMSGTGVVMPMPSGAWITVRIPADRLSETVAGLSAYGTVTSSQTDRRDVTTEAVDLRARVSALESSVARLTELMQQSSSTADLIAAESALSERQSELESLRQQLTWVQSQVEMSTLSVSLVTPAPAVTADPAGFGDGVAAGWNGLVATLNGLVIAIGFLLPWLGLIAFAALIVWGARRVVRRRRARTRAPETVDEAGPAA
ncbi:DUF4349 domain-containing protein [Microbacterium hominis]|uniref:DUF4349 domain-containing protein n=1 Tax=Microbacterium hominis TaxID=162426 RepID=UPI0007686C56|nr:DUF4349 domain-containing protein [Microbacterium hominis]KXC07149.1 hypothetical protein MhomT_00945 [Microbacterium hominis]